MSQASAQEQYDVIVVGGGAAGLSAALTLTRARLTTAVVDAGEPRNAPADGVHGLLGHEGVAPADLLARGRDEVRGYGGEIVDGRVAEVVRLDDGFEARLTDGSTLRGRRLAIATGLVDVLPDIPGVREQWGHGALHCPFCHGWEVRDQRIGILGGGPNGVHRAMLWRQWSDRVVLFAGAAVMAEEERAQVAALGVEIVEGAIAELVSVGDQVQGVRVGEGADARVVEVDAVAITTRLTPRADAFTGLGVEVRDHPMGVGTFVVADEMGRTAVPGVFAAGNVSDLMAQVSQAIAQGARAAQAIVAEVMTERAGAVAPR